VNRVTEILSNYAAISLEEMDTVALMNRVDTKFLAAISDVESVLTQLDVTYRLLEIDGKRFLKYRTVYFDTVDQDFLYQHLRGKPNRLKVRNRQYVGSNKQYFEIKKKTNKGNTIKSRIPSAESLDEIGKEQSVFLAQETNLDSNTLTPHIEVDFSRATLVNLETSERITFDFQLSFRSEEGEKRTDDFVIVEHKRTSQIHEKTPALNSLKKNHIYPTSLSKYCLGMILIDKTNKYNRYKPKLRKLNKISTHGNIW
jgi:hypothetical protein